MKYHMYFLILALLFAIIGMSFMKNKEGFHVLNPGLFPTSVNVPILYQDYPLAKIPGLSKNNYQDIYDYYPVFGSSYSQHTNNVRYWATPNNGKCTPADFCGGVYDNKKIKIPNTPVAIPFSSSEIRVNYYGSEKMTCPDEIE